MNLLIQVLGFVLFFNSFLAKSSVCFEPICQKKEKHWILSELLNTEDIYVIKDGNPEIIETSFGSSVQFDGVDDALLMEMMPLKGLTEFTVEAIFCPESEGNFEQRFLHMGEISGDRLLLEIRATNDSWYFDSFICSENNKLTLIDSTLQHPLDKWYHVAFVVNNGKLSSYVNGTKELEGEIKMSPFQSGKTSIGVRLNRVSWFKGKIAEIRVTEKALTPNEFLSF